MYGLVWLFLSAPLSLPARAIRIPNLTPNPSGGSAQYPTDTAPTNSTAAGATPPNPTLATTGVTRLELGVAGGGALTVSNLTSPVLFSMAGMNSTNGTQSLCSFWSPTLNRIDSQGCTGVPTPAPANHSIAFVPGFTAVNDSVLAWAWNISGPLAANCSQDVLYCSVTPKRKIYLNPYDPFTDGAVSCPNGSSLALRVFYGAKCGLWQHNNSAGCSWNAIKQANHACSVDPSSMFCSPIPHCGPALKQFHALGCSPSRVAAALPLPKPGACAVI